MIRPALLKIIQIWFTPRLAYLRIQIYIDIVYVDVDYIQKKASPSRLTKHHNILRFSLILNSTCKKFQDIVKLVTISSSQFTSRLNSSSYFETQAVLQKTNDIDRNYSRIINFHNMNFAL
jgi:hypothetical protein